jgi:hypothetical protein
MLVVIGLTAIGRATGIVSKAFAELGAAWRRSRGEGAFHYTRVLRFHACA